MKGKVCKSCERDLPLDNFSLDGRTNDGLNPRCYNCRGILREGEVTKKCVMCDEVKPVTGFHRDLKSPDFHRKVCKVCGSRSAKNWNARNKERYNANMRAWNAAHKDAAKARQRRYHLSKTYNLTEQEYWALFDAQNGKCYTCGASAKTKHLHVDHDHNCCAGALSCGKCIRGLLCARCNKDLLPFVDHRLHAVERAIEYVENPPAQEVLARFRSGGSHGSVV